MENYNPLPNPQDEAPELRDIKIPQLDVYEPRRKNKFRAVSGLWGKISPRVMTFAGTRVGKVVLGITAAIVATGLFWNIGSHKPVTQADMPIPMMPTAPVVSQPVSVPMRSHTMSKHSSRTTAHKTTHHSTTKKAV